jgi:hypothetical protein
MHAPTASSNTAAQQWRGQSTQQHDRSDQRARTLQEAWLEPPDELANGAREEVVRELRYPSSRSRHDPWGIARFDLA